MFDITYNSTGGWHERQEELHATEKEIEKETTDGKRISEVG